MLLYPLIEGLLFTREVIVVVSSKIFALFLSVLLVLVCSTDETTRRILLLHVFVDFPKVKVRPACLIHKLLQLLSLLGSQKVSRLIKSFLEVLASWVVRVVWLLSLFVVHVEGVGVEVLHVV